MQFGDTFVLEGNERLKNLHELGRVCLELATEFGITGGIILLKTSSPPSGATTIKPSMERHIEGSPCRSLFHIDCPSNSTGTGMKITTETQDEEEEEEDEGEEGNEGNETRTD